MNKERLSITLTFPNNLLPEFDRFKRTLSLCVLKTGCIENKVLTIGPSSSGTKSQSVKIIYAPKSARHTDMFLEYHQKEILDLIYKWYGQEAMRGNSNFIFTFGPLVTGEIVSEKNQKVSTS